MNNNRAKEIFFQNSGQHYFMAHDGYYDEYRTFKIDKSVEEQWINELVELRLNEYKQSSDMRCLIPSVDYYNRYDLLDKLLSVEIKGDYLNRLVIIELLAELMCKNRNKIENFKDKKAIVVRSLSAFIAEKIPKKHEAYRIEERVEEIKKKLKINNRNASA
jgi:hypothetical protein